MTSPHFRGASSLRVAKSRPRSGILLSIVGGVALTLLAGSQVTQAQSPGAALVEMLAGGRIPPERQGTVYTLLCDRGNEDDLAYVVEQLTTGEMTDDARARALKGLVTASRGRGITPSGGLSGWSKLLAGDRPLTERLLAVELAGLWQDESLGPALRDVILAKTGSAKLRTAAMTAWAAAAPDQAKSELTKVAADGPLEQRAMAVAALVALDLDAAAESAAGLLTSDATTHTVQAILPPFLTEQRGPTALAAALTEQPTKLTPDAAKLCARTMLATGKNAPELSEIFLRAAGIDPGKVWTRDELVKIAQQSQEKGDPVRGEAVFRREELNCVKCHGIAKGGGQIGPDLAAVGSISPPDYVAAAILVPEQDVKEVYRMLKVLTFDGKSVQGILIDRNPDRVVLRDAEGHDLTISTDDIEDEKEAGSLMPVGLTDFLTDQERFDLIRFISELGKPGPFALRATPAIQTWRVLTEVPEALKEVPSSGTALETLVEQAEAWVPIYSRADGSLPLDEAAAFVGEGPIYLMAKVDVTHAGAVGLSIADWSGLNVWFGGGRVPSGSGEANLRYVKQMPLFFRVDRTARKSETLKVEMTPIATGAEFQLVAGP